MIAYTIDLSKYPYDNHASCLSVYSIFNSLKSCAWGNLLMFLFCYVRIDSGHVNKQNGWMILCTLQGNRTQHQQQQEAAETMCQ